MLQILKNIMVSIARLFVPRYCAVCGCVIEGEGRLLCQHCRWEMPLTGYSKFPENPIWDKMSSLVPVQHASAFFFYRKGSGYDKLIHKFKYNGRRQISRELGLWYGAELRREGVTDDVDVIVPIPLHFMRLMKRGYNQSEYFARGIAAATGKRVLTGAVVRRINNRSQTRNRGRKERYENVADIFTVRRASRLNGKHILIVDDVFTTGATIESCAHTILENTEGCRISVVTLATPIRYLTGK